MIRVLPPADVAPLDGAIARIQDFNWIVFASVNAVDTFFARLLASPLDIRSLNGIKLCAVGTATSERLARHGLKVDVVPGESRAEAVVRAIVDEGAVAGQQVLLPRSDIGREVIADELRKLGADVTEVVAYRTVVADTEREGEPDVYRMLLDRKIDVVTFTSPSAVKSFVSVVGAEPAADLLQSTAVAAIGPVTAEAAAHYNITVSIMPAQYTVPALVDAIVHHYERRS
jgi:uroporphyrinogen III methyltransferase/synthase